MEEEMDMLAATVEISAGMKQVNAVAAPSGRVQAEGVPFSKSFDEGVVPTAGAETKTVSKEEASGLRRLQWGMVLTIANEPETTPVAAKTETIAGVDGAAAGDSESVPVAIENVPVNTAALKAEVGL